MKFVKASKIIPLLIIIGLPVILGLITFTAQAPARSKGPGAEFSSTQAFEHVRYLAQKIGPRPAGSKAELKAAQYIEYVLNQDGWKVREQPFSKVIVRNADANQPEQQVELINSQNIIAELPGTLPNTVVIGAHYDTATMNVPGAVDNASGVGVLLELARVLSKEPHQKTYQLVFFGAEENGLVGSKFYTSQADLSAVEWMLNVDMVGTPLEIDVAGKLSAPPELLKQVSVLAKESHIPFHISRDFTLMTRGSSQGGSSDFSSFLDEGIPALGLGIYGRSAGYFHRPEDRLDQVSLADMQTVGDFAQGLVSRVAMHKVGPQVWDELYLTFQMGENVFVLPSYGLRALIILVFLGTVLILGRFIRNSKNRRKLNWKDVPSVLGIILFLSLIIIGVSGGGEILWQHLKQTEMLYFAHPEVYLLARIGIALTLILFLANWFPKLPLKRDPHLYWFCGVLLLLLGSLALALVRIDLAFPFVFWLLCFDLLYFLPSISLALIGPYFLYRMHYELLNSEQWLGFYAAIHKYPFVFLGLYSLLLIPILLACCYVALKRSALSQKVLAYLKIPALVGAGLLILALGLVPAYTKEYPQPVLVREEWSGSRNGKLHILADDRLPSQLVKDLSGQEGKSIVVPLQNAKPPLTVVSTVEEKASGSQRILDISFKLSYLQEPYLVSLKLDSEHPFEVKTDEFLPMSKLPKKIQLIGTRQSGGNYSLLIQRTPPQKNSIHLTVETEGILTCSLAGVFPDLKPQLEISNENLSVDYQIQYQEKYTF
ncbi:M28 family peptidase [Desulfosporosinus sp. PR]|uniref:M28 family metallopeptidase n=1 Tax=Candidatus Desulfosporosinus nitrosoreducens TaxID=3401928 RepID=UPI0027FF36C7|nr:M28 family peptidase [Desulfosporosinus sp. PR]MDQ7094002.1 M28 family peptidase [Desulfosporosinus sp. PR]